MRLKNALTLVFAGMMVASMSACGAQSSIVIDENGEKKTVQSVSNRTQAVAGNSVAVNEGAEENGPITLKNVTTAKNVILMIGDGMGPQQIKAGDKLELRVLKLLPPEIKT